MEVKNENQDNFLNFIVTGLWKKAFVTTLAQQAERISKFVFLPEVKCSFSLKMLRNVVV